MTKSDFVVFILDQLAGLDGLRCRAMFGGYGLYRRGRFFGIIHRDRLYFRTDTRSRTAFQERGMTPFKPNLRQTLTSFYEVPLDILEDPERLTEWATRSAALPVARKSVGRQPKK